MEINKTNFVLFQFRLNNGFPQSFPKANHVLDEGPREI